jgi:exonuclease SbcC
MITKIKLVNWKTHKQSELEFSDGTNVIVGINGAGKSSIMDAMSFALFGTFPKLNSRKQKLDDVITSKPSKAREARVLLEFFIGGKKYNVLRVVERGKGTTYSEIRENDKLLESSSNQRVTEAIERILKMDYELFSRAVYSEQNAIDYFIELSPGERARKIDNLLRIDRFEEARKNAVSLDTRIEGEKQSLNRLIQSMSVEEKEKELKQLESKIQQESKEMEIMRKEVASLEASLVIKKKKLDELKKSKIDLERLKQKVESLKEVLSEDINEFEKEKRSLETRSLVEIRSKISEVRKKLELKEEEREEKRKEYEAALFAKSRGESEKNNLIKRNEDIEKEIERMKKYEKILDQMNLKYQKEIEILIEEERKKLEELKSQISLLNYRMEEASNVSRQIKTLTNKCPVCGSVISEDKKNHLLHLKSSEIKDLEKTLSILENERKMAESRLSILETDRRMLEDAKRQLENEEKLEEELKQNLDRISKLEESIKNFDKTMSQMKLWLEALNKEIDGLKKEEMEQKSLADRIEKLEELEKKIELKKKELSLLEEEKERIENLMQKENYEEAEKDYEAIRERYTEIKTRISEKERSLEEKKSLLDKARSEVQKIKQQKDYAMKLERASRNLKIFIDALEKTQVQLRNDFIEAVNQEMSKLWQNLYPYSDYVNLKIVVQDGNYQLQLETLSGEGINVENVSGGESTMACLVLRISLSLVLVPHLNWIILDEPTHNLDAKSVESLNQALKDQIKDFVGQVFLITHEQKLENAASGELYRIERNKDEDGYSEIIRLTENN